MLIAEPCEAAIQGQRALLALTSLAWGLPSHLAYGPEAPFQLILRHPALPWGGVPLPKLQLRHPRLTSHLAGGLPHVWWSGQWNWTVISTWHCWLTQRNPLHVGLVSPLDTWCTRQIQLRVLYFKALLSFWFLWMSWLQNFFWINPFQHPAEMLYCAYVGSDQVPV